MTKITFDNYTLSNDRWYWFSSEESHYLEKGTVRMIRGKLFYVEGWYTPRGLFSVPTYRWSPVKKYATPDAFDEAFKKFKESL